MSHGTQIVVGVNASSQEELWQYYPDDQLWNFMPSSVGAYQKKLKRVLEPIHFSTWSVSVWLSANSCY
eukprot:1008182-Amphidinium_carterae.1